MRGRSQPACELGLRRTRPSALLLPAAKPRLPGGLLPEGDPGFSQIVRGHLHVYFVPDADPNKMLSHFTRDMGQDFVPVGQADSKHRPRKDLGDGSADFNGFFFRHGC